MSAVLPQPATAAPATRATAALIYLPSARAVAASIGVALTGAPVAPASWVSA